MLQADRTGPIDEVTINGYQALVGVTLKLSPGINVIVGESDVGKSAVIRAMEGVVGNQRGDGFINTTIKKSSVVVKTEDGFVQWKKPANEYIVGGERFCKVGASVPAEVSAMLNMAPLSLDKDIFRSINIVGQSGPKFLVEDKETDVAKMIGAMTRLQPVYRAMRAATADRRSSASKAKTLAHEAAQIRLKLSGFSDLESEGRRVVRAQATLSACEDIQGRLIELERLRGTLAANTVATIDIDGHTRQMEIVLSAADHVRIAKAADRNIEQLDSLGTRLEANKAATAVLSRRLGALTKLVEIDLSSAEKCTSVLDTLEDRRVRLSDNAVETKRINARKQSVARAAKLKIDTLEVTSSKLDDIINLGKALRRQAEGIELLVSQEKKVEGCITAAADELDTLVKGMSVCPLSGGRLFDECRELLQDGG